MLRENRSPDGTPSFARTVRSAEESAARRSPAHGDVDRSALLAAILDAAPDPVVALDDAQRVLYANPACSALFGAAAQEAVGRPLAEIATLVEGELDAAPDGVRRGHAELHVDGVTRWIAYSAREVAVPGAAGPVTFAFLRDETERRRDELRLSKQSDEREQTLRALAHDLRSPLVSVLGFSRLLREEFGALLGERGTHFLERIAAAGRTMEHLIGDLLEFARIGHDGERASEVDPLEVLQQLKAELKPRLEQTGVELVLPELPPRVRCDRTRLYQLLSNLLGNALDHMGPVEAPRIVVVVAEREGRHEIVVRDNGRGVAPDQRERIFELFHSLPQPGGRKGSGIGLAIVRKIAELHGGRAFCDTSSEGGAAFHVVLPR